MKPAPIPLLHAAIIAVSAATKALDWLQANAADEDLGEEPACLRRELQGGVWALTHLAGTFEGLLSPLPFALGHETQRALRALYTHADRLNRRRTARLRIKQPAAAGDETLHGF